MTLVLTMIFHIWHQKHRQQNENQQAELRQIKKFLYSKKKINKMKKQHKEWEKIFANHVSEKGLISKIHKKLIQLSSKNTNDPI